MRYKDKYNSEVKGHYIGSYEDLYMLHCQKVEEMKNEVNHRRLVARITCLTSFYILTVFPFAYFISQQLYKSDYEDMKTRCFFPQTMTPEYEAGKKLGQCSDVSIPGK